MNNLHRFLAVLCVIILLPLLTWAQVHDYSQDYLTFNVLTDGTIVWKAFGNTTKTIEYSINGGEWISITSSSAGVSFDVHVNDEVRFRGTESTYATSKNNYSGFEGGSAEFNIEGNIMSLIYGDSFANNTALTETYTFCSIFKQSKAVSAENLILPATTLTDYCYRAMFSYCTWLEIAPELPATILAQGCYWYMFEWCLISTAPDLLASTLVKECYGHMFENCKNLNHIKCLATSGFKNSKVLENWVTGVNATGTFVKDANTAIVTNNWTRGASGIPTNWTVVDDEAPDIPSISCDGFEIELSCTTADADIYYQLNNSGSYTKYKSPIKMTGDTFIECYSENENDRRSDTISQTCVYDNRTIYEYSNQSLDSWTLGGNTITTPYSVNAIDGHSSSYAKGAFTFETDVNLRSQQPTYLWFQHADQSASIYVDNNLVEKHWGGYNAFFVDISNYVHKGTNHIKVALRNNEGNVLAPYAGDFNFNATLGKVKLFTSPYLPSMSYGYDGFHITSTVSSASATINVKTTIPNGASVVCTITDGNTQVFTDTQESTGEEMVFTTTITSPHLWNGTTDPHLYNVKIEIYKDNELYHSYERPYGLRFYEYVFNETVNGNPYTGFLLNGQPYLLRGVCVHDDLANKANALNDDDYIQEFNIITELGCNFLRLAHYPHPKEVYDKCDQLGIVVQTEAPWVNKSSMTETEAYWTHLEGQCADMVNQHYNHPCILFWGVGNEINTTYTNTTEGKDFVKGKIEGYRDTIRSLIPNAWVGYTVSNSIQDGLGVFNNPTVDWIGQNIYVGWYSDQSSNNPTSKLNTSINKATAQNTPCAYSEYGCGGTQACHSDDFMTTTTTGSNKPRHDIEYQMWLHEGHIAAIKNKPELLFTSQWQLFDIAVSNRNEGYTVCPDGVNDYIDDNLRRLNDKGLVERDHVTKKDPFYLYKAWWNQTDKFVHICGKDFEKLTDRKIKCYTNDGSSLTLYVNGVSIETVTVTDNIATFTARNFSGGDVIRVEGAITNDSFTFTNDRTAVFTTNGAWNDVSKWNDNVVPTVGSDVEIAANATIPDKYVAHVGDISINTGKTLTIANGGQLICNNSVAVTMQKSTEASIADDPTTTNVNEAVNKWYLISSPVNTPTVSSFAQGTHNVYSYIEKSRYWNEYRGVADEELGTAPFEKLDNGRGYLYRSEAANLAFTGNANVGSVTYTLSYTDTDDDLKGFNLIGNPYTHNIYKGVAITGANLVAQYCILNTDGTWTLTDDDVAIAPMQAVLVEVTGETEITIAKTANAPGGSKYADDNIWFTIKNNEFTDVACVEFKEGHGFNKPEHRNENAPMLYIMSNGEKFASANMPDNTSVINLGFEARTMGQYTFSLKAEGRYSYMHLIDKLTGNDVDMLFEDSYSFIGAPSDRKDRFVLRLNYNAGNIEPESYIFAYQSGNEIIVSGEGELQIIDVMGRVIVSRNVNVFEHIPTSGMTSGTYILRLINDYKVMTQKIVIR